MANSRAETRKVQDEPESPSWARNKKKLKEFWRQAKGNRRDLKGLPMPKSGTIMIEIITH